MGDEVEDAVTQGKGLKGKLIKRGDRAYRRVVVYWGG